MAAGIICCSCMLEQLTAVPRRLGIRTLSVCQARLMKKPTFSGPKPPQLPLNPYMMFVAEERSKLNDIYDDHYISFVIARKWRSLTDPERKIYHTRYIQHKENYLERFRKFLNQKVGNEEEQKEYLASLKKFNSERRQYHKKFSSKIRELVLDMEYEDRFPFKFESDQDWDDNGRDEVV